MKDPMNLKDLPGYIKSLQENGSYGDAVVNMGQITTVRPNYFRKFAVAATVCLLFVGVYSLSLTHTLSLLPLFG